MVRRSCAFEPNVEVFLFLLKKLPIICFKDNAATQHGNVQKCISPLTLAAQG